MFLSWCLTQVMHFLVVRSQDDPYTSLKESGIRWTFQEPLTKCAQRSARWDRFNEIQGAGDQQFMDLPSELQWRAIYGHGGWNQWVWFQENCLFTISYLGYLAFFLETNWLTTESAYSSFLGYAFDTRRCPVELFLSHPKLEVSHMIDKYFHNQPATLFNDSFGAHQGIQRPRC